MGAIFAFWYFYSLVNSSVNLSTGIWKNDAGSLTVSRILRENISDITRWLVRDILLLMRLVEMVCDVTLELGQDQWGAFCALYTESTRYKQIQKASTYTPFVSNWVFDLNLVQFCTVLQLN